MTSTLDEVRPWSSRRWCGMVGLIFGVQLGLIFWLGSASPIRQQPAAPGFTFKLAGSASAELLALHDPTLFVLPHPRRASAPVWPPVPEFRPFSWPEPTNYLLLSVDRLGVSFSRFMETNVFGSVPSPARHLPALTRFEVPARPITADHSTVELEWDQAPRRLLTPLELRSWESPEMLSNSVVQIVVSPEGMPASVVLLSGSGSKAADEEALSQANAARFEPLPGDPWETAPSLAAQLSWGRMIFRWHSLPQPPTNAPAAGH
jgi:TonB family protein